MATAKKRWVRGKLYKLSTDWQNYYDEVDDGYGDTHKGYHYAKSVHTGDWLISDCWIVNKDGEVHPGLAHSPVPISLEQRV